MQPEFPASLRLCVLLLVLFSLLASGCVPIAASLPPPQAAAPACPVTQPSTPPYTAPAPYPSPPDGYFWHGSDALWTGLPNNGIWGELPHNADGYGQKFFVWSVDYNPSAEPEPALTVGGRRLDADAPTLLAHIPATHAFGPDNHSAMLTGITFPSAGCWEVTAIYTTPTDDKHELRFVVSIQE